MTHQQLEQAVANATGESLVEIRRRGFSLASLSREEAEIDQDFRPPLVVDWDHLDTQPAVVFP